MNLSTFCKPFYSKNRKSCGIKGKMSQPNIVEFFMATALGQMATVELSFTDDSFRKWFKGDRTPTQELWVRVSKTFDETQFSRTVSSLLNEKVLLKLMVDFGVELVEGEIPDKFAFSSSLAKQFKAIADGNGETENIVNTVYRQFLEVVDFPDYVINSQKKYSKLKTLLYTSDERQFYDFFVCNGVSRQPHRHPTNKAVIDNVNLEKIVSVSQYILLVGMGGIGKSMMMRHLFLTSIRCYSQDSKLPVLVTLREFGTDNPDLFNVIVDSVHRFDVSFSAAHVHKMMLEGKCQILLDGLDEIKGSDMESFQKQLDALIDRYPQNQFVMSTRRFSNFVELSRFTIMYMLPFTHDQALELIDRLEYCPEEPKLKQQFRDRLVSDYFNTHSEFVTNPLLLTLMLMSYHRFADVPEKKYLFYDQAYQTLLQRHDSDKLAYKRVFHSVTDPSDFTLVFREFCAKSYRKGDYEFDKKKFEEYFNTLHSVKRLNSPLMRVDNFLFDVCNSACLMYEEGQTYHFLHRSFQEYFFADYYSRQDDTTLKKLGNYLKKTESDPFDDGGAFGMLYDLAPEKVERFIILPSLDEVFTLKTRHEQYWCFLNRTYKAWMYVVKNSEIVDKFKDKYKMFGPYFRWKNSCETSSVIFSKVLGILNQQQSFSLEYDDIDLPVVEGLSTVLHGELLDNDEQPELFVLPAVSIPENTPEEKRKKLMETMTERYLCDEDGSPIKFGYVCIFHFADGLNNREQYAPIIRLWDDANCPAQKQFENAKRYHRVLTDKYAHADEMDDDDF